MRFIFALLVCACMVTPQAATRRQAEAQLMSCLGWGVNRPVPPLQREQCRLRVREYCLNHGLEATCGSDGLWSR